MEFNFEGRTAEELEARKLELRDLMTAEGADLNAIEEEARAINTELETRKAAMEKKAKEIKEVLETRTEPVEKMEKKEKMAEVKEIRNSAEYINAYANYIKTGDDRECRALLTENGSGSVAVPELVYDIVKTAWEREGVMRRVKKTYLKGNLKVGFEISSSDAVIHTEGQAVNEETLVDGIVTLIPQAIKKWISISDEALDMAAEPYLQYVYDELTYRIAKKAADTLISKIATSGTQSTTTAVGIPAITSTTITLDLTAKAMAQLSDEAANPVIIMNKLTWGAFKGVQASGNYGYDPFEGLEVVFNNSLKAFSAATTGDVYMIVGDLGQGAIANFPAGEEISVKRDDYTLATSDLVRFIGREYVALGVIGPNSFVNVKK